MFTGSLLLFLFWLSPPHSVVWRLDVTWGRLCMVIRNVTHATVANNRFVKRCWTTFTIQNDGSGFHTGVHWTAKSRQDKNPLNPVCISLRIFFFGERDCAIVKGGERPSFACVERSTWENSDTIYGTIYVYSWSLQLKYFCNFFVTSLSDLHVEQKNCWTFFLLCVALLKIHKLLGLSKFDSRIHHALHVRTHKNSTLYAFGGPFTVGTIGTIKHTTPRTTKVYIESVHGFNVSLCSWLIHTLTLWRPIPKVWLIQRWLS